jgi:hypothetical protein
MGFSTHYTTAPRGAPFSGSNRCVWDRNTGGHGIEICVDASVVLILQDDAPGIDVDELQHADVQVEADPGIGPDDQADQFFFLLGEDQRWLNEEQIIPEEKLKPIAGTIRVTFR